MYMCTRDINEVTIIADFTDERDFYCISDFKLGFERMVTKYNTVLISDDTFDVIEGSRVLRQLRANTSIDLDSIFVEMGICESETIVITNNKGNVKKWIDINVSVLLITMDLEEYIEGNNYMPDAIWSVKEFVDYIDKLNSNPYLMEFLGEKSVDGNLNYFKVSVFNRYANVNFDTIFLGRYFKVSDGRHYIHPLSRTILDFKNKVKNDKILASRKVVFDTFNIVLKHFIEIFGDVTCVTAVPPKPNQQHRFYAFEKYYNGEKPLRFDLLNAPQPFDSPKYCRDPYEKYLCVQGAFECTEDIEGHILLIDDIYTSGSTVSECVKMLLEKGAEKVTVIPLAHTQYLPAANFKWFNGKFDEMGNEYKLKMNKTEKTAFWVREELSGIEEHTDIVKYYNNQNRFEINNELPYALYCDENEIKGVIFDLDDTLVRTTELERYRRDWGDLTNLIVLNNSTALIDAELIRNLKRNGYKIGIVTRSRKEYAEMVLEAYGYEYDVLISRYTTYRTKPHQDPYISCWKKMNVDPMYLISIGNEEVDTIASNKAGIYCYEIGNNVTLEDVKQLLDRLLEYRLIG